jgi:hypothetical protein
MIKEAAATGALMLRRASFLFILVLSAYNLAAGQSAPIVVTPGGGDNPAIPKPEAAPTPDPKEGPQLKPVDLDSRQAASNETKMQLIRALDAEFVHVRKNFPIGEKDMLIAPDGEVKPGDVQLYRLAQKAGVSAKIGDRVQITNIQFREKSIYFEINGGPKRGKVKWYQRIEISGMGGSKGGVDPTQANVATGGALTVEFKKNIPEMTGAELKRLLRPVLDFTVKNAGEVFMDTFPPKIRESIKKHEVLVGMNHDMVVMAKDRPQQKVRDKDDKGKEYEEWIYGDPKVEMVFVRFVGDEVVQVKTSRPGQGVIVKNEKEVDVKDGVPTLASLKASGNPQDVDTKGDAQQQQQQPAHRPSLKRPGEETEQEAAQKNNAKPAAQDDPQWGTNGKQPPADEQPPDSQSKPPDGEQKPPQ